MKPDWKDAPEWAQWVAMDGDGKWFWHADKPVWIDFMWQSNGQVANVAYRTLERRP
jgi:hypothetical protein